MGHDTEGKLTISAKEKPSKLICHAEQIFMIDKNLVSYTTRMKGSSHISIFRRYSNLHLILAGITLQLRFNQIMGFSMAI